MEAVLYQNTSFEIRDIILPEFGYVTISSTKLSDVLITKDGDYVSPAAQIIDEKIFYFVEPSQMQLSNAELVKVLTAEIK